MGRQVIDLTGQKFCKLKVMRLQGCDKGAAKWFCECDCGGSCIAYAAHLKRGSTKSCGCIKGRRGYV